MAQNPFDFTQNRSTQIDPNDLFQLGAVLGQAGIVDPTLAENALAIGAAPVKKAQKKVEAKTSGTVNAPSKNPAVFNKYSVAPVPKGSGLSEEVGLSDKQSNSETIGSMNQTTQDSGESSRLDKSAQKALFIGTPELQELYSSTAQLPEFSEQSKNISDLQAYLEAEKSKEIGLGEALLRPLAGLLQYNKTGDVSGLVSAFENVPAQERNKRLLAIQEKVGKAREDYLQKLSEAVKGRKIGTETERYLAEQTRKFQELLQGKQTTETGTSTEGTAKQGSKDPASSEVSLSPNAVMADNRIKETKVMDSINKTMEPLEAGFNQLQNAREALDKNDWQALSGILSILAKNVGADSGALSDRDLNRWLPRTFGGDLARVEAYFTSNPNAPVDPELTRGLKSLVGIAAKNMADRYSKSLERKIGQYKGSSSYKGVNLDDIAGPARSMITELKSHSLLAPEQKNKVEKREKSLEEMSDEELSAYEKKLGIGK